MDFQEQLYKLRKKSGLSQEQLADQIGVSRQAVSKWESGQSMPELDKLVAISEYFGVSVDYLINNEKDRETVSVEEEKGPTPFTGSHYFHVGIVLIVISVILLAVWGLLTVFQPSAIDQLNTSSMITLNGSGFLLIACVVALVLGMLLILRKK